MPPHDPPPCPAPFDGTLSPATFHVAQPQEEALARLEWLHGQRQRLGVVTAATGGGKSHFLAAAARRLAGAGAEVAVLSLAGLGSGEWIGLLLERLPLDPASRADPGSEWSRLEARLRENTLMERTTALLFDDLDRGPADALAGIGRLTGGAEPRFARVLVVATAVPEALAALPAQLRSQITLRIDLPPWTEDEVAAFLDWERARIGAREPLFSPVAAGALARFTGGVPRRVVQLARLALAAAAGANVATVDPELVERAWCELLPADSPAPAPQATAETATTPATVRPVRRLWS